MAHATARPGSGPAVAGRGNNPQVRDVGPRRPLVKMRRTGPGGINTSSAVQWSDKKCCVTLGRSYAGLMAARFLRGVAVLDARDGRGGLIPKVYDMPPFPDRITGTNRFAATRARLTAGYFIVPHLDIKDDLPADHFDALGGISEDLILHRCKSPESQSLSPRTPVASGSVNGTRDPHWHAGNRGADWDGAWEILGPGGCGFDDRTWGHCGPSFVHGCSCLGMQGPADLPRMGPISGERLLWHNDGCCPSD